MAGYIATATFGTTVRCTSQVIPIIHTARILTTGPQNSIPSSMLLRRVNWLRVRYHRTMAPPSRTLPGKTSDHYGLYVRVRDAIADLPTHFVSTTQISGILATDLHTLTVFGATVEDQVVNTLNRIRNVWDPNREYGAYHFISQAQTFPGVLLRNSTNSGDIVLGIELKGWYLLAKEGEPNFRYQSTATACGERDLLVVVPWVLEHVVNGSPIVFNPFIESARYAAEYRNYHWTSVRRTQQSVGITLPSNINSYRSKPDQILDKPASDRGGGFGRLARTGLMDDYIRDAGHLSLCGIEARHWRDFLGNVPRECS